MPTECLRFSKDTPKERATSILQRLDVRLPSEHKIFGRYPKIGEHDDCVAILPIPEDAGSERVYFNRTGTKATYLKTAFGFIARSGVTNSKRKMHQWRNAVNRKARVMRFVAEDYPNAC